eukprot:gb/GEZJ01004422.1/.p2 GENE.gb/GEZJ01004422.1/~~gb/GEZJ01004422.1/.p2  ORF type:complete len:125 (-),score=15.97 gb/GEZJ01004422.1/:908-1282(-)
MERGDTVQHEIEVDEMFYRVEKNMYDSVLHYAKSETSKLCLSGALASNWANKFEVVGEKREESVMVMDVKEIVPRCPMEVVREMKPYTPSVKGGSEVWLYDVVSMKLGLQYGRWERNRSVCRSW